MPDLPVKRPPACPSLIVADDPQPWMLPVDWSAWYLTDEEDMGDSCLHDTILRLFISILEVFVQKRGWKNTYVGRDNFIAWVKDEPLVRVSPDAYILRDPPSPLPKSWQLWRPEHRPPELAFELVSEDWKKDYDQVPPKYAQIGVRELVICDVDAASGETKRQERVPFLIYRRSPDGLFVPVYRGQGPAWIETLDATALFVPTPEGLRLRLAWDRDGRDLVPTLAEQVESEKRAAEAERQAKEMERQAKEAERQAKEAERQAKEAERRAKEAAEAELTVLRAELERLRQGKS